MTADAHPAPLLVVQPLLVRSPTAALMCGVSERHWRRLNATGRCPAPLDLNGVSVWSVSVLIEWIDLGCPSRGGNNGNARRAMQAAPSGGNRGMQHDSDET